MRHALAVVTIIMVASPLGIPGSAWAQVSTGMGGESGVDQQAGGELLDDGTAEAYVQAGKDLGPTSRPRFGGGNITCRWYGMDAESETPNGPVDWAFLRNPPAHLFGREVAVLRVCDDGTGPYAEAEVVTLRLPTGQPPPVDPRRLAVMARSRLPVPLPEARTNPADEQTVNLETWMWVENWEEQSRSASAGGVTATVVAKPVEQRWSFGVPGETKVCRGPGKPYDFGLEPWQQSTTCGYTFRHSSAGQPGLVFQVKASVVWHLTWSSNTGAGGDLGTVTRTTTVPMAVAEHQALIVNRRTP
jgi:hypothetical protein